MSGELVTEDRLVLGTSEMIEEEFGVSLNVVLDINRGAIDYIAIRRMEDLKGEDRTHAYEVWCASSGAGTVTVRHKYSDGARVLLRKALQALERAEKKSRG